MADYEGFLLLHDVGHHADPLYFELGHGLLQYYSRKNGKYLGQYSLTRHRVTTRVINNGQTPNQFVVSLCPVRSVHDTERSMQHFKRRSLKFTASSERVRAEWIRVFSTWRRRNWKENVVIADHADEFTVLRMMMRLHRLELKIVSESDMTIRKVTVVPENEKDGFTAVPIEKKSFGLTTPRSVGRLLRATPWSFNSPAAKDARAAAIL